MEPVLLLSTLMSGTHVSSNTLASWEQEKISSFLSDDERYWDLSLSQKSYVDRYITLNFGSTTQLDDDRTVSTARIRDQCKVTSSSPDDLPVHQKLF